MQYGMYLAGARERLKEKHEPLVLVFPKNKRLGVHAPEVEQEHPLMVLCVQLGHKRDGSDQGGIQGSSCLCSLASLNKTEGVIIVAN